MSASFHSMYVASGMRANAFLPRGFGDGADRHARVRAAAARRVDAALLSELRAQDEALAPSPARRANLDALAQPGTVVVATGQQVGLFLGPLYTLYKAASAIAIARSLSAETGARCVPLFWLQTEDHDFAEVAPSVVPRDGEAPLRLSLSDAPGQERVSLAHRALGPEVGPLLDALDDALADQPHRAEVVGLLRERYRPGVPIGRAFAEVLATLFASDGLVVYDPRQPVAARLLAPLMRQALLEAPRLEALLVERGRALVAAGFKEQIPPRQGSPLLFFHRDGAHGPRYRLTRQGDRFALCGTDETVGEPELLSFLETDPLRFSTSALLRPIAQDTLLPTAVYVGGPAEVDYFAQLSPLYSAFGLEPPLVARRSSFALVPARLRSSLHKLELTIADLDRPREELVGRLAARIGALADPAAVPSLAWAAELEQRLDALVAGAPEESLARGTNRARRTIRRSLERLARRAQRMTVEREHGLAQLLERASGWLRPGGTPQERVFGFAWFAAHAGLAELPRAIAARVDPFLPAMQEIDL